MYLLVVLLPLCGTLFAGGFGRFLGFRGAAIVTTLCVSAALFLSFILFYEVALSGSVCHLPLAPWFPCEMFDSSWGFYFDTLTVVMLLVILSVSTLVHIYSIGYMGEDPHIPRFMSYLSVFTFFMILLVTSDNLLQMFLGWEGVGLASYLLINFWFTRLQASKGSIKAMIMNRIGDFGLALGVMALFSSLKSVHFPVIFAAAPYLSGEKMLFCNVEVDLLTCVSILLFIGAVGKSAQLGLHTWLPDAMEGPTPVSALIHAATMVTAGVFLLARTSPLFEYAPTGLVVVTLVGGMTALFAATTGIVQNDLKRVIAYSTCSQLGYMVLACGLSHYPLALFHLANHAFFKALLFLGAGSVIHALSDEQDMRKMGGLAPLLPLTYLLMLIGSLSLVGFPFLTGFYSKDLILEIASVQYTVSGKIGYWLGSFCVFLTAYYSFRLLFLVFLSPTSILKESGKRSHEAPPLMLLPLFILALGSIFLGFITKDMMVGLGTPFWGNSIYLLPGRDLLVESEAAPQLLKFLPLFMTIAGGGLAYLITKEKGGIRGAYLFKRSGIGRSIYTFLNKRWYFDKLYNDFVGRGVLSFGYSVTYKGLDKGFFEILGPYGISALFRGFTRHLAHFQSGKLYHYAVVILLGLTLFVTLIGVWDLVLPFVDNRILFSMGAGFSLYQYYSAVDSGGEV